MQTRNQKIAADVFSKVQKLENNPKKKQYGSMAHKLPVLIQTSGLVQALSFVQAKSTSSSGRVLATLLDDLAQTLGLADGKALVAQSRKVELLDYMFLTKRTLNALLWYKRFSQSVLGVEAGESDE